MTNRQLRFFDKLLYFLLGATIAVASMSLGDAINFNKILTKEASAATTECPAGSYNIGETKVDGEVICKLEPTGCPYGDSIPLDSPKCAPPEDPATAYAPWVPEETVEPTNTSNTCGK